MFLSALLTDDASEEVIVEADEKPSSPPIPPPQRPPQDVVVIDTEEQNRPEYPVIPPVTGEIRFAFPENEMWLICLILLCRFLLSCSSSGLQENSDDSTCSTFILCNPNGRSHIQ